MSAGIAAIVLTLAALFTWCLWSREAFRDHIDFGQNAQTDQQTTNKQQTKMADIKDQAKVARSLGPEQTTNKQHVPT
jgi:hypothetical protein